jgi:phage terminase large subunit-like protein
VQEGLDVPRLLIRFWKPNAHLKAHGKRDRVPYQRWVEEKVLFATPGNVVDYAFIQQQIRTDATNFQVAFTGERELEQGQGGLAIDRWNATETAVKLQEEGLPVVLFGQGFASMSAPSKELERLVMANGFHHGGHPLLRKHAQAAAVLTDPADNIKPAKDKSSIRIDGIVAAVMAIGLSAHDLPAAKSFWES